MTPFWAFTLGFLAAIVAIVVWAMVWYVRSEKAKRVAFERKAADIEDHVAIVKRRMANLLRDEQDIEALRQMRSRVAAADGPMTDEDTQRLDGILKRLEASGVDLGKLLKEPIRPLPLQPPLPSNNKTQGPKGVH